jgi:hypothetical protein
MMQYIKIMENCLQLFKSDSHYGKTRFKWLGYHRPPFEIEEAMIDYVSKDEFNEIDIERIPLLLGSQFGLSPDINAMPEFFNGYKLVAILGKSLLSGHVSGLSICQIEADDQRFFNKRLVFFENRKPLN